MGGSGAGWATIRKTPESPQRASSTITPPNQKGTCAEAEKGMANIIAIMGPRNRYFFIC